MIFEKAEIAKNSKLVANFMASIKVKLDTRRGNKNNEYPIKVLITNNQTNAMISTGVAVKEDFFDGTKKAVKPNCPNAKAINSGVEAIYAKCFERIKALEFDGVIQNMTATQIKDAILNQKKTSLDSFTDYAEAYAKRAKTISTYESYRMMLRLLREFFGKENILFSEITFKTLSEFDYCYQRLSDATRAIVFRNIRAIFNQAIMEDLIDGSEYPFKKFKIKSYKAQKDFMPIEFFRKLLEVDVSHSKRMQVAKDFFLLSFYFCGINPIDLFNLKKSKDFIRYERTKTKQHNIGNIIVGIQPEAQSLIDKYKGENCLLSFAENYKSFDTFYHNHRKFIKEVGKEIGFPELTFYYARYSWATYALNYCDVPEYIISKALGHSDTTTATKYYIAFDWAKVDNANRKVLDFIKQ